MSHVMWRPVRCIRIVNSLAGEGSGLLGGRGSEGEGGLSGMGEGGGGSFGKAACCSGLRPPPLGHIGADTWRGS